MPRMAVNSIDTIIEAQSKWLAEGSEEHVARSITGKRTGGTRAEIRRRIRRIRREIEEVVCSATWADDCLYRGAEYAPDFECQCPICRKFFPRRRHPRGVRESRYSLDCQIESEEDPELAEDLARLRNDRLRVGSVFIGHSTRTLEGGKSLTNRREQ
jgi:hypothetical protein